MTPDIKHLEPVIDALVQLEKKAAAIEARADADAIDRRALIDQAKAVAAETAERTAADAVEHSAGALAAACSDQAKTLSRVLEDRQTVAAAVFRAAAFQLQPPTGGKR